MSTGKKLDLDLNLPDAPEFISTPPRYTLAEMIKLSEPLLPFWNRQRPHRLSQEEIPEPFRFVDDEDIKPNE